MLPRDATEGRCLMRLISALCAALLIVLAACGSPVGAPPAADEDNGAQDAPDAGGGDGGGGDGNACLNTNEEVSAAFDVVVTEAENTASADGSASCIYYTDREAFDIAYTISLSAGGGVGQMVFDAFKGEEDAEPAPGIGDEAIWYGGGLIIRKGDRVLSLGGLSPDMTEDEIRSALEELGRKAADRL
jgi:hypothetical protein